MTKTIHLDPNLVPQHLRGGYRGKKFCAVVTDTVTIASHDGLWDGGSRTTKSAISLATGQAVSITDTMSAPWSDARKSGDQIVTLKPGFAVVEHSYFKGKDMGLRFYLTADDVAPMLPAPVELSHVEKIVLAATASYKSSYNGMNRYDMARRDWRYSPGRVASHNVGDGDFPSQAAWDDAKVALAERKLMTKRGAITPAGRNAIG